MSGLYNIEYTYDGETRLYCAESCDLVMAQHTLENFKRRYLNADGTGKAYPNGKGFYPISNPRIVRR